MQKEKTPYINGLCTIDEEYENNINEDLIPKMFDSTCREYFYFKAMFISILIVGIAILIILLI